MTNETATETDLLPQPAAPVKRKRRYAQGTALDEFGIIPICDQVDDEAAKVPSDDLAHEIWAAAQTAPGEGIEDAVIRIARAIAPLQSEIAERRAEVERLNRYYKNGIDCFANPCEKHSGERTPPFAEFFEKYGGQCLICVVDNNKALQAKNKRLAEALRLALDSHGVMLMTDPPQDAWKVNRVEEIGRDLLRDQEEGK